MTSKLALALLLALSLPISVHTSGLPLDLNLPPPDESIDAAHQAPATMPSNAHALEQWRAHRRAQHRARMDQARQGAQDEPIVLWGRKSNISKGEYIELRRQKDRKYRAMRKQDPEVHQRDLQLRRQYRARSKAKNSEAYQRHRQRGRENWIKKKSDLDSDPVRRQAHLKARRERARQKADAKVTNTE